MARDRLDVEVLPDGTVKIAADKISAANHRNADELIRILGTVLGGTTTRNRKPRVHTHATHTVKEEETR